MQSGLNRWPYLKRRQGEQGAELGVRAQSGLRLGGFLARLRDLLVGDRLVPLEPAATEPSEGQRHDKRNACPAEQATLTAIAGPAAGQHESVLLGRRLGLLSRATRQPQLRHSQLTATDQQAPTTIMFVPLDRLCAPARVSWTQSRSVSIAAANRSNVVSKSSSNNPRPGTNWRSTSTAGS